MIPGLDHLDPANWWPHYEFDCDRRAVPAFLLFEDPDLQGYIHLGPEAESTDPWRVIEGMDKMSKRCEKPLVVEFGNVYERRVEPDTLLYISGKDFARQVRPELLKGTFDELWAQHEAGIITRADFDRRAGDLRQLRDYYTRVLK